MTTRGPPVAVCPVIDAHAHVGPWHTPDFAGHRSTFKEAVRTYDAAGFSGALLMGTDAGNNADLLAEIEGYRPGPGGPGFRFVAWIDPDDPGLSDFLGAHAGEIAALKIHPSFLRRRVTDTAIEPYLAWAQERGVPVIVHCGRWQEMSSAALAVQAAGSFPHLNMILAHMGGDAPKLVCDAIELLGDEEARPVYLGTESIRQPWLLRRALDALGPARLIFGSDYNLNSPRSFRVLIDELGLDPAGLRAVLFENINHLLPAKQRIATRL